MIKKTFKTGIDIPPTPEHFTCNGKCVDPHSLDDAEIRSIFRYMAQNVIDEKRLIKNDKQEYIK